MLQKRSHDTRFNPSWVSRRGFERGRWLGVVLKVGMGVTLVTMGVQGRRRQTCKTGKQGRQLTQLPNVWDFGWDVTTRGSDNPYWSQGTTDICQFTNWNLFFISFYFLFFYSLSLYLSLSLSRYLSLTLSNYISFSLSFSLASLCVIRNSGHPDWGTRTPIHNKQTIRTPDMCHTYYDTKIYLYIQHTE